MNGKKGTGSACRLRALVMAREEGLPTRTDRAGTHVMRLPSRDPPPRKVHTKPVVPFLPVGGAGKHDHRASVWVLGREWLWCYRCGSIRENVPGRKPWTKPTGPQGKNPAET